MTRAASPTRTNPSACSSSALRAASSSRWRSARMPSGVGADGSPPLAPRNLIAFTFTDKAGAELKERIAARVAETHGELPGLAEMFVGTIHGFCLDLLQRESPEYLKYTVLDDVRQKLGGPGASDRAAEAVLDVVHSSDAP